jgi:hypothetical protein
VALQDTLPLTPCTTPERHVGTLRRFNRHVARPEQLQSAGGRRLDLAFLIKPYRQGRDKAGGAAASSPSASVIWRCVQSKKLEMPVNMG